jgi:hypothetical protein
MCIERVGSRLGEQDPGFTWGVSFDVLCRRHQERDGPGGRARIGRRLGLKPNVVERSAASQRTQALHHRIVTDPTRQVEGFHPYRSRTG